MIADRRAYQMKWWQRISDTNCTKKMW